MPHHVIVWFWIVFTVLNRTTLLVRPVYSTTSTTGGKRPYCHHHGSSQGVPNTRVLELARLEPGNEENGVLQTARRWRVVPNDRVHEECLSQSDDEEDRVLRRARRWRVLSIARVLEGCP